MINSTEAIKFVNKRVMDIEKFLTSFRKLEKYCNSQNWYGWDPYDGLKSHIFKNLPFIRNNKYAKIAWIQLFKHSPVNLRKILLVPKGYNTKGLALFLTGYCNIYNLQRHLGKVIFEDQDIIKTKINRIAGLLIDFQSSGFSGACWGYNFDWQSIAFFLPEKTPTVVATSFVTESLIKAYEVTGSQIYLDTAISSASFIKKDLNRIEKTRGFMFSYSPIDRKGIYNATLLGSKTLSLIYKHSGDNSCKELAYQSALAVCDKQNENGSFPHSDQIGNKWRDNFHTAFKLESLTYYQKLCSDDSFNENIQKGFDHWINNFFESKSGQALYYENNHKLIDLHCAAQAIPTLYNLDKFKDNIELASSIINWAIDNMQDEIGYFYFQKKNKIVIKIPYMRWPNAWMFYGISYYFLGLHNYLNDFAIHQTGSQLKSNI